MHKKPVGDIEYVEKTAVITLETDVMSDMQIDSLRELIINTVLQRNCRYLLLDFVKCSCISTSALGLLIRIQKKLYEKQIRMILSCLDKSKLAISENDRYAYEIFRVLELKQVFDICNRPAHAIAERIAAMTSQGNIQTKDGSSTQAAMV